MGKYWDTDWTNRFPIMFRSTRRIRWKLGLQKVMDGDPEVNNVDKTDIEKYALGDKRTIKQWMKFAGVDLETKKISGRCKDMRNGKLEWVPWLDDKLKMRVD